MKSTQIPFLKFDESDELIEAAVKEVMNSGLYFNGPETKNFQALFGQYIGCQYLVPTANCTDALEIVLRQLKLKEKDHVMVPAFGWYSDASMVQWVGAQTTFVDIDLSSFSPNLAAIQLAYHPDIKALILPHLFGMVNPEMEAIVSFCADNDIFLIEDCAQAHGASHANKLAGSFGDISVFSFYPTKNLGSIGDGGAILTNNKVLSDAYSLLANHGQVEKNQHEVLGRNSRMDEIQAAILNRRLPSLAYLNKKRAELAEVYANKLKALPIILPDSSKGHVYHQFVILIESRDALQQFLLENGVETVIHYPQPLYKMTPFKKGELVYKSADMASRQALSLPIYPNHSVEEILFVCEQIEKYYAIL